MGSDLSLGIGSALTRRTSVTQGGVAFEKLLNEEGELEHAVVKLALGVQFSFLVSFTAHAREA